MYHLAEFRNIKLPSPGQNLDGVLELDGNEVISPFHLNSLLICLTDSAERVAFTACTIFNKGGVVFLSTQTATWEAGPTTASE